MKNETLTKKIKDFLTEQDIALYLSENPNFQPVLDQTVEEFITQFQAERSEEGWQEKLARSGDQEAMKLASQKANVATLIGLPVDPATNLYTFPGPDWNQAVLPTEEPETQQ